MDKAARKLFAQAAQAQSKRKKEQKRIDQADKSGQQFCTGCYAVLLDGRCPGCDLGFQDWQRFCRNCLTVHAASVKTCATWTPEVK